MIIDTHTHCYWDTLISRIDDIVSNMSSHQVTHAIQIGCDEETSIQAIRLAKRFPGIFYATVGVHPDTAAHVSDYSQILSYEKLLNEYPQYIVGIGETGLDYHSLTPGNEQKEKENQYAWWRMQYELCMKYKLPCIIHSRDAREDTLAFIRDEGVHCAVMHCFSEDWDFAEQILQMSDTIYFSFSGILTYKSASSIQEAARNIPLDRIIIETDAPFLSPVPLRGQTNEPSHIRHTLEKLIELRLEDPEYIETQIYENSRKIFGIGNGR